jgi:hypothetical protein
MTGEASETFFPLDIFLRNADPNTPSPQEVADATGLTIIVDEDAARFGADCWIATLMEPTAAANAYRESGGTVSSTYASRFRWPRKQCG